LRKPPADGGDKVPAGWIVTAEGLYNRRIAAVAEFAGSYQDAHMYRTNLGGGRFYFLKDGTVRPFAQLLAGKGRSSAIGDEVSAFTLQPGAGIDIMAGRTSGFACRAITIGVIATPATSTDIGSRPAS
jgi:hypothetical protein